MREGNHNNGGGVWLVGCQHYEHYGTHARHTAAIINMVYLEIVMHLTVCVGTNLNAIVTHPENSKNTSRWRVSDVGSAQARREDTRDDYRNVRIYAAPFAKPFFTSGYTHPLFSCHGLTIEQ